MGFFKPRNSKGKYKNRGWLANSQNEAIELQRAILWEIQQGNAIAARRLAIEEGRLKEKKDRETLIANIGTRVRGG